VQAGFCLFPTALGLSGIAWGPDGLRAVVVPAAGAAATRAQLLATCGDLPEAPPPAWVRAAIAAIAALLAGERRDLAAIPLDMRHQPPFRRRVLEAARTVPPGTTITYGELARRCGAPGAARAVGQALARNPFAIVVPCHRVVGAGGRCGGFSAPGGTATKLRLLAAEGAVLGVTVPGA
jgi:methylated-DNA-[protein]-cysteine S-methyltransferase